MTLDEQITQTQQQVDDLQELYGDSDELTYVRAVLESLEQLKQLTQPITGGY